MKLPVSEIAAALVPIFNDDLKFCSVGPVFQPIMGYLPNTLALPQSAGGFSLRPVTSWSLGGYCGFRHQMFIGPYLKAGRKGIARV